MRPGIRIVGRRLSVIVLTGGSMQVPIRSMKFWINAFIPRDVPGYTRPVPGQTGLTMIPGPMNRVVLTTEGRGPVRPGMPPLVDVSDCYYTDQRDFSSDIHAKSRMHAEVRVDFTVSPPRFTQWHNCDFTTE